MHFSDFVDRITHDRSVRFWTVVSGVATLIGVVLTCLGYASNLIPHGSLASTNATPTQNSAGFLPTRTILDIPTNTPSPSPTATVAFSTPTATAGISLKGLDPIDGSDPVSTQPVELNGITYLDLVRENEFVCGSVQVDYDLGKRFSTFTAIAGLSDTYSTPDVPWIFAVYSVEASGKRTLFEQIMKFGQVANIHVSVSGVVRLRLSIEWINPGHLVTCSAYSTYDSVWAMPELTP